MSSKMQSFVALDQALPDKRQASLRRSDFAEIYHRFAPKPAADQASRCAQCGVPFCQLHCPLHNNIPDWLRLTAEGRLEEAYELAAATNTFPEICGRICPQDRLCEGSCVIEQSTHGAVTIGAVERFITDNAFDMGWVAPPRPRRELGASVGIIGAGPAGLAAAEKLRRRGYRVEVYDRHDRVGGLLIYGIPNFKLDKTVVARRAALLAEGGIRFHLNFEVGRDASLAELRRRHDAVLIAAGVYQAQDAALPGSSLDGVHQAMAYLTASNRKGMGDRVPAYEDGSLNAAGKNVVVIGGGDTAMDCLRTAIRQGARSVTCLYRRDRLNMPGSRRETQHAEEEGVRFEFLCAPEAFLGERQGGEGAVTGVMAHRVHLGMADASGRQTPQPIEGSRLTLPADMVIKALGFAPENLPATFKAPELAVSRAGTLMTGPGLMTGIEGVFAAGDIVRGASLVVWAIRDGRDAADGIHAYIQAKAAQAQAAAVACAS